MTSNNNTIEDVYKFWNDRPCNLYHSNKEIGTKEYFEEVTKRKYFVENHILDFADFDKYYNKKVLEVGCGIGTASQSFCEKGAIYTGIDLSDYSVELAKKRFQIFKLNGTLLTGNIEEITNINNQKFDLIYSFGVLHHTVNIDKAIDNIYNMLDDNGEFKLMLYAKNSWKTAMIEAGLDQPEAQTGCPIAYSLDKNDVLELISGLFSLNEYRQDHIFPYVIDKYVEFEYELQPWFKTMPREMYESLCKNFGWHGLITATKI
jgi:SAM-dependent methyltransferase